MPRDALERIARLAADLFDVESGLVTFVGADRQLNVACAGHVPEDVSLEVSFCARAIQNGTLLVVEDASTDERFAQNPLVVEEGGLRFYAGAPIESATGELIGTVTAFSGSPCTPEPGQLDRLRDLAALAAELLDRYLRERQYETALEDPKTHLAVLDPDGILVDVGSAALRRVDASRDDVVGREAWQSPWVPDTEAARRIAKQKVHSVVQRGTPVSFQTEYRGTDGARRVRGTIRPVIGTDGTIASLVVVGRDVTEPSGRADAVREKLEEARQSLRRKSTLLGAVGHEVRNPLTSILAAARTLRHAAEEATAETESDEETEDLKRYVQMIEQSGRRLLTAVNGVLELSKLDVGAAEPSGTPVNLSDHAEEVVATFDVMASQHDVDLILEASSPVWASAYEEGVYLVAQNLVSNAVKYTESGGRVWVRTYLEDCPDASAGESPAKRAVFEVEDTGVGMTPEEADRMFEAFYRSGREPKRGADGTGLGLALVQQIVRRMNGSISYETEEGVGTTIAVRFPGASEREEAFQKG